METSANLSGLSDAALNLVAGIHDGDFLGEVIQAEVNRRASETFGEVPKTSVHFVIRTPALLHQDLKALRECLTVVQRTYAENPLEFLAEAGAFYEQAIAYMETTIRDTEEAVLKAQGASGRPGGI